MKAGKPMRRSRLASPDIFSYDEQGHLYCPTHFPTVIECAS
jgi:hypothetical protein